uniref:Uncharacterized protein n=1 Tax=uncultured marine virus TaxID=186617 RepID=A0A0F7LBJ4_9VIRU|nr:hypothetical protein [uncultured marine virus]
MIETHLPTCVSYSVGISKQVMMMVLAYQTMKWTVQVLKAVLTTYLTAFTEVPSKIS